MVTYIFQDCVDSQLIKFRIYKFKLTMEKTAADMIFSGFAMLVLH